MSATYRSNRAAAHISAHEYADALEDAKAADELEPNNAKTLHRLARIYTHLGRPDDALGALSQVDPPATTRDKSPALVMKQQIQQAEELLRDGTPPAAAAQAIFTLDQAQRGLGLGVERPRKWKLMRGEALLRVNTDNSLGEAQNIAMNMLRTNSQDSEALVLRGRALYAQGENDKAIQHFRQALSCDPDFRAAQRYYRMVRELDRKKEEGNAAYKAGRYNDAVGIYSQALDVDPLNKATNAKIVQNRAQCYFRVRGNHLPASEREIWKRGLIHERRTLTRSSNANLTPPSPTAIVRSSSNQDTPRHGRRRRRRWARRAPGKRRCGSTEPWPRRTRRRSCSRIFDTPSSS